MTEESRAVVREYQFVQIVAGALPELIGATHVIENPRIQGGLRPDLMAILADGGTAIIEVKAVTPNTRSRLIDIAHQLLIYGASFAAGNAGKVPTLVLAVPGVLSEEYLQFFRDNSINVLDGPAIQRAAGERADISSASAGESASSEGSRQTMGDLIDRLGAMQPGRADWSPYQTLAGDILSVLLCPPLEQPIRESANQSRINRRDFIFPNYADERFWSYMRSVYEAHYIVADAKNYVGQVKKRDILQLANYLSPHGAGLFGMIVSRSGDDRSSRETRREQWVLQRKMIVVLSDEDLRQMATNYVSGGDAGELVRQKIEDFRLAF